MKIYSRITIGLSFFFGIIFLARLLILSARIIATTDTPDIYLLLSLASLFFLFVTFNILLKYVRSKDYEFLTKMESITCIVQFISIILLLLSTKSDFVELTRVSYYLGYILLLLGGISFYRSKHYISISHISWGVFILLWISNFYNGVYMLA
jgi:hypothetical protein